MNRRKFLKCVSAISVIMSDGSIVNAGVRSIFNPSKKVALRFVVASDGHYGLKNTPYETYFETLVKRINEMHKADPFQFCMINGDIIHDDKKFFAPAKKALDQLELKYYVSQGNHDHVAAAEWEQIWNMPVNFDFTVQKSSFLIATTSNEDGDYLCPDVDWFRRQLATHQHQDHIFIFLHINPGKLTKHGVDCPALFELFRLYPNIKAVFNGHDHDEDGIKIRQKIPFIFDAHFGGDWGTAYRGFRVVELMEDNSIVTYIMNPVEKINAATF